MKIPFAKQAYESRSRPFSAQRCVNLYMEPGVEGTQTESVLYGTPGFITFANLGAGRIWGMHVMGANLYVVSGNNVYVVDSTSGATNLGSVGTVANVVMMDDDGTHVIILLENGAAYLATASTLVQITDGDYVSASSVTVLDSFTMFSEASSAIFQISALNDATAYDPLDIATVEGISGNLVCIKAFRGECWMFKQFSTEVYYNSGAGSFPFIPIGSATMQRGCAAKRSVAVESNTIMWLGDDRIVYLAQGYTPTRVSTFAIEKDIETYATISDAEAFIYTEEGHKFYVLTFPTEDVTWVYDLTTRLWHERESFGYGRWRASSYAFFNGRNLVGDFQTGKIYQLDLDTYTENGTMIRRIATTPPIWADTNRITFDRLQVTFDPGQGLLTGQGSDPVAMLRFSDDGGFTWSNERVVSIGQTGLYKNRAVFRRLGGGIREKVFELTVTDPILVNITGAFADIRVGNA